MSRAAQRARQETLAREMGLIAPISESGSFVARSKNPYPEFMRKEVVVKVYEKEPCPCQKAGITEGREKLATGWCIDGVFWPFHALNVVRMVRNQEGEESAKSMKNALDALHAELDLDLGGLTIRQHVCQHEAAESSSS